jgi:hypothetical protein
MNMEPTIAVMLADVARLEGHTQDAILVRDVQSAAHNYNEVAHLEHCIHLGEVRFSKFSF